MKTRAHINILLRNLRMKTTFRFEILSLKISFLIDLFKISRAKQYAFLFIFILNHSWLLHVNSSYFFFVRFPKSLNGKSSFIILNINFSSPNLSKYLTVFFQLTIVNFSLYTNVRRLYFLF